MLSILGFGSSLTNFFSTPAGNSFPCIAYERIVEINWEEPIYDERYIYLLKIITNCVFLIHNSKSFDLKWVAASDRLISWWDLEPGSLIVWSSEMVWSVPNRLGNFRTPDLPDLELNHQKGRCTFGFYEIDSWILLDQLTKLHPIISCVTITK